MKKEGSNLSQLKDEAVSSKDLKKKVVKESVTRAEAAKWVWPLKVFVLAISLSIVFTVASEFLMSYAGIVLAIFVVVVLVGIAVLSDVVGVAVAAAAPEPFNSMSARKVKGAKEALLLVRNADKVSVICNDIIGDICGIVSGTATAAIVARLSVSLTNPNLVILIMVLSTALLAGLTISGKSFGKVFAINQSEKIVLRIGKILAPIWRKSDKQK